MLFWLTCYLCKQSQNIMKKTILFILCAIVALLAQSCSKDADAEDAANPIVGTWRVTKVKIASLSYVYIYDYYPTGEFYLHYNANGVFSAYGDAGTYADIAVVGRSYGGGDYVLEGLTGCGSWETYGDDKDVYIGSTRYSIEWVSDTQCVLWTRGTYPLIYLSKAG